MYPKALNEGIAIKRLTTASDGAGGIEETWDDYALVRAEITPLSGKEIDQAAQTIAPRNYRLIIRNSSIARGIQQDDRIVWRGLVMEIVFIALTGLRDPYLRLDAIEHHHLANGVIV